MTEFGVGSTAQEGATEESFFPNFKNFTRKSDGTTAWIAEFHRHMEGCLIEAKKGQPAEVREAMDTLFGLLDRIDRNPEEMIFFADEAGSWRVGVDWARVLPIWFKVLSATPGAAEYAQRVHSTLSRHYHHGRDKMLSIAHRRGARDQRKALAEATSTPKKR